MEGLVYEKVWRDWGVASRGWKGRFWKEEVLCRPGYILGDDMLKDGSTRREEVRWLSFFFFSSWSRCWSCRWKGSAFRSFF
jgi:hypothetical protein